MLWFVSKVTCQNDLVETQSQMLPIRAQTVLNPENSFPTRLNKFYIQPASLNYMSDRTLN